MTHHKQEVETEENKLHELDSTGHCEEECPKILYLRSQTHTHAHAESVAVLSDRTH